MNDMHVYAEELGKNPYYSKIDNERVRWLVGAMNEGRLLPRPDFVLGLGDLIDGETFAHLKADFEVLMEMLRPLRCPFYPCYGNHEVMQNEGDPEFERVYRGVFGDDRVNIRLSMRGSSLWFSVMVERGLWRGRSDKRRMSG
jgi:predicted MPP superfamily phosphohydrolase